MISKQKKISFLEKAKKELKAYPTVAIASNASLPSKQYNLVMKKTRGQVEFLFGRHTLLTRALEESRPETKPLLEYLGNGGVLVLSSLPAFKLFRLFKQNKSKTAAKPGAKAPFDIVVPAGDTNLAPGPVLTELKQAKIEAKIQGPKVVIAKDALVAKKGEVIVDAVAKILSKLGIEPMDAGVEVKAVWDDGLVYKAEVLDVDEAALVARLQQAHSQAVNLAVFAGVLNETTVPLVIAKAVREAMAIQKIVDSKSAAPVKGEPAVEPAAEPVQETQPQESEAPTEQPAQ
ncbi:MAG TPA: 50S ribosomal protein L10 [Candidatus Norongarragalinales archaeon]|nr:50S ribosomal protein L10 [Candidatus Norongarragalinales archaeon]